MRIAVGFTDMLPQFEYYAEDTAPTETIKDGAESPHSHPTTPIKRKSSPTGPLPELSNKAHKGTLLLWHNIVPFSTRKTMCFILLTCATIVSASSRCKRWHQALCAFVSIGVFQDGRIRWLAVRDCTTHIIVLNG